MFVLSVLIFPPLKEIPEYRVEERSLTIPNDLNQSYCLRVEVSKDSGKVWTTAESCVPPSGKSVPLNLQTATNVNVSVCLVYRPEVCGEPVISKIRKFQTSVLVKWNWKLQISLCIWRSRRIRGLERMRMKWAAPSEFGTYRLCEQRRFRRACASAQSRQNLRCSLIQAVNQEEPSDRKPDPWSLWMAGHAQLKFVMTECSKTQIRLTRPKWNFWFKINGE